MSYKKPRVVIPKSPVQLIDLGSKVYLKHAEMGFGSPLNSMQSHTWDVNGPLIAQALEYHNQAEKEIKMAEELYSKRDLLLDEIDHSVKSSRDLLLGVYRDNPKEMGQWGFVVDDSVRPSAKKPV